MPEYEIRGNSDRSESGCHWLTRVAFNATRNRSLYFTRWGLIPYPMTEKSLGVFHFSTLGLWTGGGSWSRSTSRFSVTYRFCSLTRQREVGPSHAVVDVRSLRWVISTSRLLQLRYKRSASILSTDMRNEPRSINALAMFPREDSARAVPSKVLEIAETRGFDGVAKVEEFLRRGSSKFWFKMIEGFKELRAVSKDGNLLEGTSRGFLSSKDFEITGVTGDENDMRHTNGSFFLFLVFQFLCCEFSNFSVESWTM